MIEEHDCIILTEDLPDYHLKCGVVGTVVSVQEKVEGYLVEFMPLKSVTIAVTPLFPWQVREVNSCDIATVGTYQSTSS